MLIRITNFFIECLIWHIVNAVIGRFICNDLCMTWHVTCPFEVIEDYLLCALVS